MLEGKSLDIFMDRFWDNNNDSYIVEKSKAEDRDMDEYSFPKGGFIISPVKVNKLPKRTWVSLAIFIVVTPIVLFYLVNNFQGRKSLLLSLLMVVYAMIPFFMVFEGRKPQTREMMVLAVLAAIGVASRAAFFMLPHFKPIAAVVIMTGISFGGEAGFLVASIIMLISNMFMGQGPWTPWQMFSYGLIGFLAGILFRKGILKPKRWTLCVYGFLSVLIIFGGIMNPVNVLMTYGYITPESLIAHYISGFPVDMVHASSTAIFLWFLSRPMLEKLERIKKKYGMMDR